MAEENKEPWFGEAFFRKLMLAISQLWIIVTTGALIMVLTVWVMIFTQNIDVFDKVMDKYVGEDKYRYDIMDGNSQSGYVANTNVPKQLGGAIFASIFAIAMGVFILISLAADLAWRFPAAQTILSVFHMPGLWDGQDLVSYSNAMLWGNMLLKWFITVATGSTSFYGLLPNNEEVNAELFAIISVFILFGSSVTGVIAQVECVRAFKRSQYGDIEAGKLASARSEGQAQQKKEDDEARQAAKKAAAQAQPAKRSSSSRESKPSK